MSIDNENHRTIKKFLKISVFPMQENNPIQENHLENNMFCPCCKSNLIEDGLKPLETLVEHVCDPNGTPYYKMSYKCSNTACVTYDANIVWSEGGEIFGSYRKIKEMKFIDNNNAPFGTFQRQMNIEIRKRDENKLLFTFPCWPLKEWKCYSDWQYKSNLNGDILSKKLKLEWVTDEGYVHTWGHTMVIYSLRVIYDATWHINRLKSFGNYKKENWWRIIAYYVSRIALKHRKIQV